MGKEPEEIRFVEVDTMRIIIAPLRRKKHWILNATIEFDVLKNEDEMKSHIESHRNYFLCAD